MHDRFVLFHKPSGKTHFVNDATAHLLRTVLQVPRDLDGIVAQLAPDCPAEEYETISASIQEQLSRLEELGLVESR